MPNLIIQGVTKRSDLLLKMKIYTSYTYEKKIMKIL